MADAAAPDVIDRHEAAQLALSMAREMAPRIARRIAHDTRLASNDYYGAGELSRFRKDRRDLNRGHIAVEFDEREQESKRGVSRWLWRNSPAYRAPIIAAADEILGEGLYPMGLTDEARAACDMFRAWADDKDACDIRGLHTLPELQRLEVIDCFVDGDQGQIMVASGRVQNITADRIVNPTHERNTPHLAGGVQTDVSGRPVGFWVAPWDEHGRRIDRAEAEKKNPRFFTFLNCPDLGGSVRTPPLLVPAFDRVQDLEYFIDATIQAAKFAASVGGWVESPDPAAFNQGLLDRETAASGGAASTGPADGTPVEPNMLYIGAPGSKISQLQAQHPNTTFDAFVARIMRIVCASIRFPYEIALQDFSALNFSTARAIQMQAERFALPWRRQYIHRRLLPVYRWKVAQWVAEGRLPSDPASRARMLQVAVPPPPYRTLDLQKETAANAMAFDTGQLTERDFWTARNRDWQEVKTQRLLEELHEQKERERLGLPQKQPRPGAAQGPMAGEPGAPRLDGAGDDNADAAARAGVEADG